MASKVKTIHTKPAPVPTREEFHRYYSGAIALADFSTESPNPYRIDKIASAIKWSENHMKL